MKKSVYICLVLSVLCTMAYAVPAHPGGVTRTLPDGTQETMYLHGDEFYHWADNNPVGILPDVNGPALSPLRQASGPNKVIGVPYLPERGLVILVNFKDLKFQKENTRDEMDSLMNGKNYTYNGSYKSVREYFYDQSNGHYHPKFDVIGPVELDSSYAYYGTNDRSGLDQYLGDMVLEACIKADLDFDVDFSQYAKQDGKKVDFVFLYYAGPGENYPGVSSEHCWPLQYNLTQCGSYINRDLHPNWTKEIVRDGVTVDMFAYTNEVSPQNVREGIGTFCHEFGHVLGLADYYNTNGSDYYSCIPGNWHTMALGCYNNDGNIPPSYSPFEKFFFGWITPTLLNKEQTLYTLPADGQTFAYISKSGEAIVPTQYEDTVYYFENRQGQGWDQGVDGYGKGPGACHGMLIWRVVFNKTIWRDNTPNNVKNRPRISIVPSTGSATVTNTNTDVYPGSNNVTTKPLFNDFTLYRIQERDGIVSFQLNNDDPTGFVNPLQSTYRKVLEQGQVWIVDPKNNQKRYTILGHE